MMYMKNDTAGLWSAKKHNTTATCLQYKIRAKLIQSIFTVYLQFVPSERPKNALCLE